MKQLQSPLPLPTTLPLLSACIASTKTVIANPVLHLSNHIHDILHTITLMEAPPHPDIIDDRVRTLTHSVPDDYIFYSCLLFFLNTKMSLFFSGQYSTHTGSVSVGLHLPGSV